MQISNKNWWNQQLRTFRQSRSNENESYILNIIIPSIIDMIFRQNDNNYQELYHEIMKTLQFTLESFNKCKM